MPESPHFEGFWLRLGPLGSLTTQFLSHSEPSLHKLTRLILRVGAKDTFKLSDQVTITIDGNDTLVEHFGEAVRDTVDDHNEKVKDEDAKWRIQ